MTRDHAIDRAEKMFDGGAFFDLLARRVSHRTDSRNEQGGEALRAYLTGEMRPYLEKMGFACEVFENPVTPGCRFCSPSESRDSIFRPC